MNFLAQKYYAMPEDLPGCMNALMAYYEAQNANMLEQGAAFLDAPWAEAKAKLDGVGCCDWAQDQRVIVYYNMLKDNLATDPFRCAAFMAQSFFDTVEHKDTRGIIMDPRPLGYTRMISATKALALTVQNRSDLRVPCTRLYDKMFELCVVYGNDSGLLCDFADYLVENKLHSALPQLLYGKALRHKILTYGEKRTEALQDRYQRLDPDVQHALDTMGGLMNWQIENQKKTAERDAYIEERRRVLANFQKSRKTKTDKPNGPK